MSMRPAHHERVKADRFGEPVAAADAATVAVWDASFGQLIDLSGDPVGSLAAVNAADDAFVLGPVLCAAARVLGGWSPAHPLVVADVRRVDARATTPRELGHREAVALLVVGEFGRAAACWDRVAAVHPRDLLAIRLAHDLYLHNGDADGRLRSSEAAIRGWRQGERGYAAVAGQLAFAYEELGRFTDAERWARQALDVEPGDAWARHALMHVFESEGRHDEALELLHDTRGDWRQRTLFANHLWWHYALRMLGNGEPGPAFDVLDRQLGTGSAFDLCDATSLVWWMELAGLDVADRWLPLARHWAEIRERHHSAFVDVHAAMAFAAAAGVAPDDDEAARFWDELAASHLPVVSENDVTFATVVKPLAASLRVYCAGDRRAAVAEMRALLAQLHRIGGSVIQRSIIAATISASGAEFVEPEGDPT